MSKYRNTVYYNFKSWFLVIFSFNYHHLLVLKIPFPDHTFPKISKFCTENLHSPSIGNAPTPHECFYVKTRYSNSKSNSNKVGIIGWKTVSLILWLKKLPIVFYGYLRIVAYWIPWTHVRHLNVCTSKALKVVDLTRKENISTEIWD